VGIPRACWFSTHGSPHALGRFSTCFPQSDTLSGHYCPRHQALCTTVQTPLCTSSFLSNTGHELSTWMSHPEATRLPRALGQLVTPGMTPRRRPRQCRGPGGPGSPARRVSWKASPCTNIPKWEPPPCRTPTWLHTPTQAADLTQPGQTSPKKLLGFMATLGFVLFSPLQKQQQQNLDTCKATEPPPFSPGSRGSTHPHPGTHHPAVPRTSPG